MSTTKPDRPTTTGDAVIEAGMQSHPDIPVIGPITGSWTCDLVHDEWWWSEEMYAIHGFAPGEVAPTTELVLRHKHPEDRDRAERAIATAFELGTRFSLYHRIIDAHGRQRHVLTVGKGNRAHDGRVVEVSGYMVDLTDPRRRDLEPTVNNALENALKHRGAIDLAKGALMVSLGIGADEAFAILRTASNRSNLKLNLLLTAWSTRWRSREPQARAGAT